MADDQGPDDDIASNDAFRSADPPWVTHGGLRGPRVGGQRPAETRKITDAPIGSVQREATQGDFPADIPETLQEVNQASVDLNISFLLRDASTTSGRPPITTNKVMVLDGLINFMSPDGMGTGDFVLVIDDPAESVIYAEVGFNPTTLLETSRLIKVWKPADGAFPESRVEDPTTGFLIYQIGYTFLDTDGKMLVWNVWVGDINFAFGYGVVNAKRGLLPMSSPPGWLDLTALE